MVSVVMACLLFVLSGTMPSMASPLTSDNSFDIFSKTSISNIKRDSSPKYFAEQIEPMSSEPNASRQSSPSKRSTMLLNKLMHALHKAIDSEEQEIDTERDVPQVVPIQVDNYPMDLHRRGEDRMTRYWRCYFNAVSCF